MTFTLYIKLLLEKQKNGKTEKFKFKKNYNFCTLYLKMLAWKSNYEIKNFESCKNWKNLFIRLFRMQQLFLIKKKIEK